MAVNIAFRNTTRSISPDSSADRLLTQQIASSIDSLFGDHKRGASEVALDVWQLFVSISEFAARDSGSAENLFKRTVKSLANGQPTMAPILNLLNQVCQLKDSSVGNWELVGTKLRDLLRETELRLERIKLHIRELPAAGTLIAYSNSSTIAEVVIEVHKQLCWPKLVFCGEGRPMMEGLLLARRLAKAGIDVTLFTDAALMSKVIEVDAVWIGGDCLSQDGLINKVGSRALAMLCQSKGIPFISICGSDKVLSPDLMPYFRILPQNPDEITGSETKGVKVHNEYFESVPFEMISYIMTEAGMQSPQEAVTGIASMPLAPLFAELVPIP